MRPLLCALSAFRDFPKRGLFYPGCARRWGGVCVCVCVCLLLGLQAASRTPAPCVCVCVCVCVFALRIKGSQ